MSILQNMIICDSLLLIVFSFTANVVKASSIFPFCQRTYEMLGLSGEHSTVAFFYRTSRSTEFSTVLPVDTF